MKDLIAALLILFLVLGLWFVFLNYAESQTHQLITDIRQEILPLIYDENWPDVQVKTESLNEDWHKFRRTALCLLHTETINSIDLSIARTMKYAKAEDQSNTAGELNAAASQLSYLTENQKLTLQNLF